MQMFHSDVNPFRKSCTRLRTKAPDIKTTTVVDRSHSIPRYADFVHFTGVTGRLSLCGLWMFQINTMANSETEVYELLTRLMSIRVPTRGKSICPTIFGRGLAIASLNINSLLSHIDELRVFMSSSKVDILHINESKLDSTIRDDDVFIPGFEIVRKDRKITEGMEVEYVHTYALIWTIEYAMI